MMTRRRSVFTPVFSSRLASLFSRYVDLKRALGRRFDLPCSHPAIPGPLPS